MFSEINCSTTKEASTTPALKMLHVIIDEMKDVPTNLARSTTNCLVEHVIKLFRLLNINLENKSIIFCHLSRLFVDHEITEPRYKFISSIIRLFNSERHFYVFGCGSSPNFVVPELEKLPLCP